MNGFSLNINNVKPKNAYAKSQYIKLLLDYYSIEHFDISYNNDKRALTINFKSELDRFYYLLGS